VPSEWRLFIDGSTSGLKAVLLYNGQRYPSVPIFYSTDNKESYDICKDLFDKIGYQRYNWRFCGDLKIIAIILGLKFGNTTNPCFLCDWAKPRPNEQWVNREGRLRQFWTPSEISVVRESLIDPTYVLLPPLHIKLGIMTQLIKRIIYRDNPEVRKSLGLEKRKIDILEYLNNFFEKLSIAKIQGGVFNGPDIRKLMANEEFPNLLDSEEKEAWESFREVITDFFGNFKNPNYRAIVNRLLKALEALEVKTTVKIHFLMQHVDYFPDNLGQFSGEQGERFHQEIKKHEHRYKGKLYKNMLADHCWNLIRESSLNKNNDQRHFFVKFP
jgi:hypothetical protein